ncbi:hypothetical protein [Neobacillus cucumis]|uniref:hypothetical protein n=1 Tax=Neobacillus cucumis TaxID=1740721 RepID=UPI00285320E6|nr:hypothetical protein [Neobacillus cucumis]MDR4945313.1 hypothetical protein [Neobacillus cucumis]
MSKKDINFQSLDSLKHVSSVINEAAEALKDPRRTIVDSAIPEVLAGVAGAAIGGAASFAALWALGTSAASMFTLSGAGIMGGLAAAGGIVGGGAVAGVFVLAAPVAILAGAGVGITTAIKKKQLKQEKDRLYKEALQKHDSIINELKKENVLTKERAEYLHSLNILLQKAIKDLKSDLGVV